MLVLGRSLRGAKRGTALSPIPNTWENIVVCIGGSVWLSSKYFRFHNWFHSADNNVFNAYVTSMQRRQSTCTDDNVLSTTRHRRKHYTTLYATQWHFDYYNNLEVFIFQWYKCGNAHPTTFILLTLFLVTRPQRVGVKKRTKRKTLPSGSVRY